PGRLPAKPRRRSGRACAPGRRADEETDAPDVTAPRTRVVRVDAATPDRTALGEAALVLARGGVVAFPTETFYGLGAAALERVAIRRIFELKGRPETKPLLLLVDSIAMAEAVGEVGARARALMVRHWPGALTLVLRARPGVPEEVTAGTRTVGVRLSPHPVALGRVRALRDAVTPAVDDLLIVTNSPELYAFLKLPMVADVYPDHGSLGGIYSGLRAAPGVAAFTVACDMPFLHADVVRLVVERVGSGDVVIPRVGGQLETLHALYAKSCLGAIEARLVAGRLKIVEFFHDVRVVEIAEREVARYRDPALVFMNVNTPEELERARQVAAHLSME